MVDCHCHIIYDVDDGSDSIDMSLEMARIAAENGTKTIIATPHADRPGTEDLETFERRRQNLNRIFSEEQIDITLLPGAEIYGRDGIENYPLEDFTLCSSKYLLIEFKFEDYQERVLYILNKIRERGLIPIVAHPERYEYIVNDYSFAQYLAECGYLFQVNSGSLTGLFGRHVRDTALQLLDDGLVFIIGSDSHEPFDRTTDMSDAFALIENRLGAEKANEIFILNPNRIINHEYLTNERKKGY